MTTPRKFRVWDGSEMHLPPHEFHLRGDGHVARIKEFGVEYEVSPNWEPMHYTGLTDAEGTEVYEGDVLSYKSDVGEVRFEDGAFWWFCAGLRPKELSVVCEFGGAVIGSRYEDPQLVEQIAEPT